MSEDNFDYTDDFLKKYIANVAYEVFKDLMLEQSKQQAVDDFKVGDIFESQWNNNWDRKGWRHIINVINRIDNRIYFDSGLTISIEGLQNAVADKR